MSLRLTICLAVVVENLADLGRHQVVCSAATKGSSGKEHGREVGSNGIGSFSVGKGREEPKSGQMRKHRRVFSSGGERLSSRWFPREVRFKSEFAYGCH